MIFLSLSLIILVINIAETSPLNKKRYAERPLAHQINYNNSFDARRRDVHRVEEPNPVTITNSSAKKHFKITRLPRDPIVNTVLKATTTTTSSYPVIHNNVSIQTSRQAVLLPDLDSQGKPQCLSHPSDTFCETVNNYPKSSIKHDIEYTPVQFLELFGSNIEGRKSYNDDDISEERVCRRIPKVIYPQMAKNQANQWVYVVNEVEYTQSVVTEVCEKEGRPCAYLDNNLPPGMYSICKQKYSYKRLLALHPSEKRTYPDTFKFPSCCACYVKSPSELSRRLKK